jgi:uncharacterized protein (TIGR02246 family)
MSQSESETVTQTEIKANNDRFCEALGAHDIDQLAAMYDPDVTLLIPGAPPIQGRAAVITYYEGVFAAGVTGATMQTLQVDEVGDALAEVGTYTMAVAPEEGEAFEDTGKYMVVHRRQSHGGLAMWLDMFHSDGPTST